ncbi:MAG: PHP-associated domain-containing protein, partial [Nitrolancea sp.]
IWHLFASCVGLVAMFAGWRRVVLANVRHVRHEHQPNWFVAWFIGMQQIASHVKTVIGILQSSVSKDELADFLHVEGIENLEPHLGERGIIIVAPHAGPYPTLGMTASRWLRARSFTGEFAVVVRLFEPMRSRALLQWFSRCFLGAGVTVIEADSPPRVLGRRLRTVLDNRGIVVLFVDEPTPTPSMVVPFFDSTILLPAGPVRLAKATGSVIIPSMATYGRGRKVTLQIAKPIEPASKIERTLTEVSSSLEGLISQHLDQWSMLTPIWPESVPDPAPKGYSYADLHTHTIGSDGLCTVEDWSTRADEISLSVVAITDHDHISTVRRWHESNRGSETNVLPGVEITARGRIVHIGILFPHRVPSSLPKAGTPLFDVMRWARSIDGSLVVLVHPLPGLWRIQLRRLARAGLLPDAIETSFPLAFWRTKAIERAADRYGLAKVGGTDAHLLPDQLGKHVTLYPGETVGDLVQAIRCRSTEGTVRDVRCRPPLTVYALQSIYSWLLPFRSITSVERTRQRLLMLARRKALESSIVRRRTPREKAASTAAKRRQFIERDQRTG